MGGRSLEWEVAQHNIPAHVITFFTAAENATQLFCYMDILVNRQSPTNLFIYLFIFLYIYFFIDNNNAYTHTKEISY